MEEDRSSWACRLVPAGEEGQVSSRVLEGCQTLFLIRFSTCLVAVVRARCAAGHCFGCCFGAQTAAMKIVKGLREEKSRENNNNNNNNNKINISNKININRNSSSNNGNNNDNNSDENINSNGRVSLGGVLGLASVALDEADERPGMAVLVLIAVDAFAGNPHWAYVSVGKGSFACFHFDIPQMGHQELTPMRKSSSSTSSPLSSSPVSPASPVMSAANSSSSSPRLHYATQLDCKYEFSLGACASSMWFVCVVDADLHRPGSMTMKPSAASTMWKRSLPPGSILVESIGGLTRTILQEIDKGLSQDLSDLNARAEAVETSAASSLKAKRGEVSLVVIPVPQLPSNMTPLQGPVLEEEHSPLGVMIIYSPAKALVTLMVRTVPFGSLSCCASENQVTLFLSRREDQMGQSLTTKWTQNVKKWVYELQGEHFKREVLLPCKIVASSQKVSLLDNGIVEVTYDVRETPHIPLPTSTSSHQLSALAVQDELTSPPLLHQSQSQHESQSQQQLQQPTPVLHPQLQVQGHQIDPAENQGTVRRAGSGFRSMFKKE